MTALRWGIVGCGDVTEVKSGPGFQKARGSALQAVMRRDRARAEDYARRHGVPRVHDTAEALIDDPDVDAVYIATPPESHCALALRSAAAGKPCLVEKPMATTHVECVRMVEAFARAKTPLWVAYYRRALPRFLLMRDLVRGSTLGRLTSIRIELCEPLAAPAAAAAWRFQREIAGGGLFYDKGSHAIDLLEFFGGPVERVWGTPANTGGAYAVEDAVAAAFRLADGVLATGLWNFNAGVATDEIVLTTSAGELRTAIYADADVVVVQGAERTVHPVRNPPHVHQPLIQSIVDELAGRGRCDATGESGARASWVLERCVASAREPV